MTNNSENTGSNGLSFASDQTDGMNRLWDDGDSANCQDSWAIIEAYNQDNEVDLTQMEL